MRLVLYTPPKPLKRARHTVRGSYATSYYTAKDKAEMDTLRYAIINALTVEDKLLIAECMENAQNGLKIALKLMFTFSMPKSYSKKKKERLRGNAHTNKVDIDNLIKNVLDRGSGILWVDDKFIYKIEAVKVWGDIDKIEIEIDYERSE